MNKNNQSDNDSPSQDCEMPDIVCTKEVGGHSADPSSSDETCGYDGRYVDMIVEAALFSSPEPLSIDSISFLFDGNIAEDELRSVLSAIRTRYSGRGVELVETAGGWRFLTSPRVQHHLDRLRQVKPPRYSRAVMETLAVVAYRQPVTRGDIEEIRGVSVSLHIIRTLEDRGWIVIKGRRDSVGRPALYTTTVQFLDDFGLQCLADLPKLQTFGPVLESIDDLPTKEKI
ncbi:SMC-Scp complex subunit ScpB [Candidatus Ichthyocystis hellenicum]|uniref:SMC-Scp complex subunit ScpB n=1 Tax=Candidatus Ichthyocystis hellenicum TaxID=1561003 RepID=UPI000B1B777B|nr:SMC-Scp complex subunit ScpB [Candidatus Ichthyocystis hellenicum]